MLGFGIVKYGIIIELLVVRLFIGYDHEKARITIAVGSLWLNVSLLIDVDGPIMDRLGVNPKPKIKPV